MNILPFQILLQFGRCPNVLFIDGAIDLDSSSPCFVGFLSIEKVLHLLLLDLISQLFLAQWFTTSYRFENVRILVARRRRRGIDGVLWIIGIVRIIVG